MYSEGVAHPSKLGVLRINRWTRFLSPATSPYRSNGLVSLSYFQSLMVGFLLRSQSLLPSKLLKLVLSRLVIQKRLLNRVSKEDQPTDCVPESAGKEVEETAQSQPNRLRSQGAIPTAAKGSWSRVFFEVLSSLLPLPKLY
jgi:hypothetical protein